MIRCLKNHRTRVHSLGVLAGRRVFFAAILLTAILFAAVLFWPQTWFASPALANDSPGAAPQQAASTPGNLAAPIPPSYFGMHSGHSTNWPSVPFGAVGKGAVNDWVLVQTDQGVFSWDNWDSIDEWVSAVQTHGVGLFHRTARTPMWATSDPASCDFSSQPVGCTAMVSNIKYWDSWWRALVTRYKGQIQVYDLWNEPGNTRGFTGTFAQMVTLTRHEHNIIRSIDPSALIVSPSGNPTYMDKYWAAGGVTDVDAVSFHAYPFPPTLQTGNVAEDRIINLAANMKSVMAKYGLANKPLWDTEGSWGIEAAGAITDPDLQASFLARYCLIHWSLGVTRFYWYVWDNPSTGNGVGGLLDNKGNPTQAAIAYGQVYQWMVGATMTQACTMASDSTWTCGFQRPGGYRALAVWNNMTSKQYNVPNGYSHYRDLSGNVHLAFSAVPIGIKPILLEP
jgi:hypothetical protein